ncbi:hypothetical protein NL676_016307 [Syzygium grande]|nr:hypothetical protein NL676_016307 [Syzygium grande]
MDSKKGQGSVLKAILHAKRSNQIVGIYGRMGDLGAIDAKYDIAILTACPGLDYIVLLRKESLGVTTFMILEKQVGPLHKLKEKRISVRQHELPTVETENLGVSSTVSAEAVRNAENELSTLSDKLSNLRRQIADAVRHYQSHVNATCKSQVELAKCHKEVDSLHSQLSGLENRLGSLEAASKPGKDELDRLEELKKITRDEEQEIGRIMSGHKN